MITLTVKETSDLTGWSQAYIRSACKRGVIGDAWCCGAGERMSCVISPGKLADFLGITTEELENNVRVLRLQSLGTK